MKDIFFCLVECGAVHAVASGASHAPMRRRAWHSVASVFTHASPVANTVGWVHRIPPPGRGMSSPCAMPRWPRLARAFDVDRPLYRGRVELSRRNRERRPPQSPHIGAQQAKDGLEQTSGSEMAAR
eukprot:scaffold13040_cov69-Phaeocystis_antarctica.AAC.5